MGQRKIEWLFHPIIERMLVEQSKDNNKNEKQGTKASLNLKGITSKQFGRIFVERKFKEPLANSCLHTLGIRRLNKINKIYNLPLLRK